MYRYFVALTLGSCLRLSGRDISEIEARRREHCTGISRKFEPNGHSYMPRNLNMDDSANNDNPVNYVPYHSYIGEFVIVDTYKDNDDEIEAALRCAQSMIEGSDAVGVDFEFGGQSATKGRAEDKFIALVQIATRDFVMALRTKKPQRDSQGLPTHPDDERLGRYGTPWENGLPIWLRSLLLNPKVIKATVGFLGNDVRQLKSTFNLDMTSMEKQKKSYDGSRFGVFELQEEVEAHRVPGFEVIANRFGFFPYKTKYLDHVSFPWDQPGDMPEAKVRYAIEDAWFPLACYHILSGGQNIGLFMSQLYPNVRGNPVTEAVDGSKLSRALAPHDMIELALQQVKAKAERDDKICRAECDKLLSIYRPFGKTLRFDRCGKDGKDSTCYFQVCQIKTLSLSEDCHPSMFTYQMMSPGLGLASKRRQLFVGYAGPSDDDASRQSVIREFSGIMLSDGLIVDETSCESNQGCSLSFCKRNTVECISIDINFDDLLKLVLAMRPPVSRDKDQLMRELVTDINAKFTESESKYGA